MGEWKTWLHGSVILLAILSIPSAYLAIFSDDLILRGWGLGVLTMMIGGILNQLYREISQNRQRRTLMESATKQLRRELTINEDTVLNYNTHLLSTMAWNMASLSGLVLSFGVQQLSDITDAYVKIEFYNHDLSLRGVRSEKRQSDVASYINRALKHLGGKDFDVLSKSPIIRE